MKKRIFIAIQYMEIGGVERSLIGLLGAIDYTQYEVDLFVYQHTGELMQFIPKSVNLLPEVSSYTTLTRPIAQIIKEGYYCIAAGRLQAKGKALFLTSKNKTKTNHSIFQYIADSTTCWLPKINNIEYDLAISFQMPHNIVRDKITAKKKIAWIHTDYSTISIDTTAELPVWDAFDYIASISEDSTTAFIKQFPTLTSKIILIENILSPDFIKKQALTKNIKLDGEVKLLTVGRFCYPKAFDKAVHICAELRRLNVPVTWYAIGYGDEQPIKKAIKDCGMENYFIILGKKTNPYPYMAACDIYVQPSRYEGKAVAVREAQILNRPVVITDFPTAASQLKNGFDGVVIPMDITKAAYEIKALIENKKMQTSLKTNMNATDYGNIAEVKKIYKLMK